MIDPQILDDPPGTDPVSDRTLRQFAALCLAILGVLFALSWYRHTGEPTLAGWISLVIGLLVGVPGLIRPSTVRPVFLAAIALTPPIGRLVSVLLLGVLYYGMVTPLALTFRLARRDVLRRRRPAGSTYWIAKDQQRDVRRYLRQYQRQ